jgi:hypothetical protein
MVVAGEAACSRMVIDMDRRIAIVAACALTLTGCASWLPSWDITSSLPSAGATTTLQLESEPAGAEAKTSVGASCRTPCSVSVPASSEFSVSFARDGYATQTVSVRPLPPDDVRPDGETGYIPTVQLSPNPVYVELEPAPSPTAKKTSPKTAKPKSAAKPAKPS